MELGVLNINPPGQDDPMSSWTPPPDFVDGGHLDREDDIL